MQTRDKCRNRRTEQTSKIQQINFQKFTKMHTDLSQKQLNSTVFQQ